MWNLIPIKTTPPTRLIRYCCAYLKEHTGDGQKAVTITGIRWAESPRRKRTRAGVEVAYTKTRPRELYDPDEIAPEEVAGLLDGSYETILNPIIDWTDADVWQFIHENGVAYCSLYDEGFTRLGCIGCPLAGPEMQEKEFARWPKYKENYMMAFARLVENNRAKAKAKGGGYIGYKDAQAVMDWWLKKDQ